MTHIECFHLRLQFLFNPSDNQLLTFACQSVSHEGVHEGLSFNRIFIKIFATHKLGFILFANS